MTAVSGSDRRREIALREIASGVLEELDPLELQLVLREFASREALVEAMLGRAVRVEAATGSPVPDELCESLLVATLSRGPQGLGVHANNGHALQRYGLLRDLGAPPARIALRLTGHHDEQDARDAVRAYRADAELDGRRGESPLLRSLVCAAVAVATDRGDADLVRDAEAALERGAALAGRYRAEYRPIPDLGDLPLGNPDILLQVAGYARAVCEATGSAAGDPLDDLAEALPRLAGLLRRALTRGARFAPQQVEDEPDSVRFLDAAAAEVGGDRARSAFRKVRADLFRLGVRRDERVVPVVVDDLAELGGSASGTMPAAPGSVHELATFLVEAGTAGLGAADRAAVHSWLVGARGPDRIEDLVLLVTRVRDIMGAVVRNAPSALVGGSPADEAVAAAVAQRISAAEREQADEWPAVRQAVAGLPPLWTRRSAAERGLRAAARTDHSARRMDLALVALLGTAAARGPVQILWAGTEDQHRGRSRCRPGHGREVPVDEVCPARGWGEIGLVDSYSTVAAHLGLTSEAVRRRLARYVDAGGAWSYLVRPRTP